MHHDALPAALFRRLVSAVREIGNERLQESYVTNFWFALDAQPGNLAEEVIARLCALARPGPECIGVEWWLGRLAYGQCLALHFDRDMTLQNQTGQVVNPLWSSILYLNRFPTSPTVVLDQILGPDQKTLVPLIAKSGKAISPTPNQYVVYRGNLYHGVISDPGLCKRPSSITAEKKSDEMRLTLLINYWHRRPLPPVCRDYDGTVYGVLQQGYRAR